MSEYYKDQDLIPEQREKNVRDAYKKLHKAESEILILQEANGQLAEKIKMLDLQRQNAEFKVKDTLIGYRKLKEGNEDIKNSLSLIAIDNSKLELENKKLREALEFYADGKNWKSGGSLKIPDYSKAHQGLFRGGNRARKALEK